MRRATAVVLWVLFVSACGGGAAAPTLPTPSTLATDNAPTRVGDDIFIPDFSLLLGDGTVFETAAVDTPLYIMFWAEW